MEKNLTWNVSLTDGLERFENIFKTRIKSKNKINDSETSISKPQTKQTINTNLIIGLQTKQTKKLELKTKQTINTDFKIELQTKQTKNLNWKHKN